MARIAGVDIPKNKRGVIALTYIFGVGRTSAQKALAATGVNPNTRVKDLVDDDDRQDDDALGDRHHRWGDLDILKGRPGPVEKGEKNGRQADAQRVVAAEERHGDTGEAEPEEEAVGTVGVDIAEDLGQSHQPGYATGQEHGLHDHPGRLDAARGGRLGSSGRDKRNSGVNVDGERYAKQQYGHDGK